MKTKILILISLLSFFSSVSAVSYYGSATPSYTSISSSGGVVFPLAPYAYYGTQDYFYQESISSVDTYRYGFIQASIESGYSGTITTFGGGLVSNISSQGFEYVFSLTGSSIIGTLYAITIGSDYIYTPVSSQLLLSDFPSYCAGASDDCVVQFLIDYHLRTDILYPGLYIKNIRTIIYDGTTTAKHYNYTFDASAQDIKSPWYLNIFNYNTPDYFGYRISNSTYFGSHPHYFFPVHRNLVFSADMGTFNDYVSAHIDFSGATFPNSLGITSGIAGVITSTGTGTDYFADCSSFLDVGCYIKGTYNSILSYFTSFSLSNFAFSGNFDSCGSFGSGTTTQTLRDKFTNIIALINPIPPIEGGQLCTIFGTYTIHYSASWPSENFFHKYIPGQVPQLEIDPKIVYGQTLVDLVTIFGMMIYIFYHRKPND